MLNIWRGIVRASARAVLALPHLLQHELARIRLARHGDVYLTTGLAAGMLVSLCAVHTFGYRRLASLPVEATATQARQVLAGPPTPGPWGGAPETFSLPDSGEPRANENLDVEG